MVGLTNRVLCIDGNGKLIAPTTLPEVNAGYLNEVIEVDTLPATGEPGIVYVVNDVPYIYHNASWQQAPSQSMIATMIDTHRTSNPDFNSGLRTTQVNSDLFFEANLRTTKNIDLGDNALLNVADIDGTLIQTASKWQITKNVDIDGVLDVDDISGAINLANPTTVTISRDVNFSNNACTGITSINSDVFFESSVRLGRGLNLGGFATSNAVSINDVMYFDPTEISITQPLDLNGNTLSVGTINGSLFHAAGIWTTTDPLNMGARHIYNIAHIDFRMFFEGHLRLTTSLDLDSNAILRLTNINGTLYDTATEWQMAKRLNMTGNELTNVSGINGEMTHSASGWSMTRPLNMNSNALTQVSDINGQLVSNAGDWAVTKDFNLSSNNITNVANINASTFNNALTYADNRWDFGTAVNMLYNNIHHISHIDSRLYFQGGLRAAENLNMDNNSLINVTALNAAIYFEATTRIAGGLNMSGGAITNIGSVGPMTFSGVRATVSELTVNTINDIITFNAFDVTSSERFIMPSLRTGSIVSNSTGEFCAAFEGNYLRTIYARISNIYDAAGGFAMSIADLGNIVLGKTLDVANKGLINVGDITGLVNLNGHHIDTYVRSDRSDWSGTPGRNNYRYDAPAGWAIHTVTWTIDTVMLDYIVGDGPFVLDNYTDVWRDTSDNISVRVTLVKI